MIPILMQDNTTVVVLKEAMSCVVTEERNGVHGDTLWKIAERFLGKGNRYTEIVKLNGLKSNVLMSGQVLQIPEK